MPEDVTPEEMLEKQDERIRFLKELIKTVHKAHVPEWEEQLRFEEAIRARLSAETGECPICKIHGEKVRCMRCGKDFYWANILQFCENCTSQTKPTAGDAGEGVECEWKSFGVCMLGSDYKPEPSHCFHCGKEFVDGEERVFKVRAFHTYCPYK